MLVVEIMMLSKIMMAMVGLMLGWTSWASLTIIENQNKTIELNAKIDTKVMEAKGKLDLIDYKLDEIADDLYVRVLGK